MTNPAEQDAIPRAFTPGLKPDLTTIDPGALVWRTSSFSSGHGGNCVEAAPVEHGVILRDSKNLLGPILAFSWEEWDAWLAGCALGEFSFQG